MPRTYPETAFPIQSKFIPTVHILKREMSEPPSHSTLQGTFASWELERERLSKMSGKKFKDVEDFRNGLPKFLQDSKNYHLL